MKKGSREMVMSLTMAVAFILLSTTFAYSNIIKPIFYNDQNTESYNSLSLLKVRLEEAYNSNSWSTKIEVVLQLKEDYTIMIFGSGTNPNYCNGEPIAKPFLDKKCKEEFPCVCLYDDELEEDNNRKTLIDCKVLEFYDVEEIYTEFKNTKDEYEFSTCQEQTDSGTTKIGTKKYKPFSYFAKKANKDDKDETITERFLIYTQKEIDDKNKEKTNIFIEKYDSKALFNYKESTICPNTEGNCKGKHFDFAFPIYSSQDVGGSSDTMSNDDILKLNEQIRVSTIVCKFDIEKNICVEEKISLCEDGFIKKECSCENTLVDKGICNKNKYDPIEFNPDFCFIYGIGACEDYSKAAHNGIISCDFNFCNVELETNCYWKRNAVECKSCPKEECDLSMYGGGLLNKQEREINPCGCAEIDCKEISSCEDYATITTDKGDAEEFCRKDPCKETDYNGCVPKFEYNTITSCIECPKTEAEICDLYAKDKQLSKDRTCGFINCN